MGKADQFAAERRELAEARAIAAVEDAENRERLRARGFPKWKACLGPGCTRAVLVRSPARRLCGVYVKSDDAPVSRRATVDVSHITGPTSSPPISVSGLPMFASSTRCTASTVGGASHCSVARCSRPS